MPRLTHPLPLPACFCSADGYGYSDKENVCFKCAEGCTSCSERACLSCSQGWAFADSNQTTCTKVGWGRSGVAGRQVESAAGVPAVGAAV